MTNIRNLKSINYNHYTPFFLNKKALIKYKRFQIGDVYKTHADNQKIIKYLKKEYYTSIEKGVREYIAWYKDFYG